LVLIPNNLFQIYENLKEQFQRLKITRLGLVEFNFDSERFRDLALAPSVGAQVWISPHLSAAFTRTVSKSTKKTDTLTVFFVIL